MDSHSISLQTYIRRFLACFITLFILGSSEALQAQFTSKRNLDENGNSTFAKTVDSSSKKQRKSNDSIQLHYFVYSDSSSKIIDTTIEYLNHSPIIGIWESDLGNFASASKSIYFQPDLTPNFKFGIFSNRSFLFLPTNVKYYNTTRPFTDLYYRVGSKQEQIIAITHTRNVNDKLNFMVNYQKEGSPGSYLLQRTNNDHLAISSNYHSRNQQYFLQSALCYNKIQQDENGGVQSESFLKYANYNNKRLVPVILDGLSSEKNRSTVTNYYRELSFNLKHDYFIGKKDSVMSADSSEMVYTFRPVFGIEHELYYSNALHRYKDLTPDSLYYLLISNLSFVSRDSVYSKSYFGELGNAFSLAGNVQVREKVMQAKAGYGFEINRFRNIGISNSYLNNYIFGSILKSAKLNNEWLYQAYLKSYFTGALIGNTLLTAEAGRKFNEKIGEVNINFSQSIQAPSLLAESFETNYYSIQSSLKKQTITKIGLNYLNERYQTSFRLNHYLMANYFYYDTTLVAKQFDKLISLTQIELFKRIRYRRFFMDNTFLIQLNSGTNPLHLPVFASRTRVAYENKILKSKLHIMTGFEVNYNTPYKTDSYSPFIYNFVTQYNRTISNIPCFSYFFNFKVKTFRASIDFEQIQQLFAPNNINYAMYPGQNFLMRFGFHWFFVN